MRIGDLLSTLKERHRRGRAVALVGPHRPLVRKYFTVLFVAVVAPLLANGAIEAWFGYRDQRDMLDTLLRVEAASAAGKIEGFLNSITDQLGWAVQLPWTAGGEERHRVDALRLLRQVPAITNITLMDNTGRERLYVSRVERSRIGSGVDRSRDPPILGVQSTRIWHGPVTFLRGGSEPYMTIAVAGNRAAAGVVVCDINLRLVWDVITAIRIGETGKAFVFDRGGRIITHPDISMVLRGTEDRVSAMLRLAVTEAAGGEVITTQNPEGDSVLAAIRPISGPDWNVFVEQPTAEAFAPIRAALWRTGGLLTAGTAFAGALAFVFARRMTGPIRLLEQGAERIGAGQFEHRIEIATRDEFERLANRFNQMAVELAVSQERQERIARLKRFLAPQVAELVEQAGDDSVLAGQRAEVVVTFCDLRGFTAFSSKANPDEIMAVLGEYYEALGSIINTHGATLTSFAGDGLMVLLNAPVLCSDPAVRAVEMAIEMQNAVQARIVEWQRRGHIVGFGVGLAMGLATVGRIGYENRLEYTAIGNVVNLASRLCSSAGNEQILVDPAIARSVDGRFAIVPLGARLLKGYDVDVPVFAVGDLDKPVSIGAQSRTA